MRVAVRNGRKGSPGRMPPILRQRRQPNTFWTRTFPFLILYEQRQPGDAAEPCPPPLAETPRQHKLVMLPHARIQPRRRITEAFAAIFEPEAAAILNVLRRKLLFPPFRRPAELAAGSRRNFLPQNIFVGAPPRVTQPHPGEMKKLMHTDAREFPGGAVERDRAFS